MYLITALNPQSVHCSRNRPHDPTRGNITGRWRLAMSSANVAGYTCDRRSFLWLPLYIRCVWAPSRFLAADLPGGLLLNGTSAANRDMVVGIRWPPRLSGKRSHPLMGEKRTGLSVHADRRNRVSTRNRHQPINYSLTVI